MEIAQFLTKKSASVSTVEVGFSKQTQKVSGSFNDYMNSFLEVANEVKNTRRVESVSNFSSHENHSFNKVSLSIRKESKFTINKDDFDSKDMNDFPLVPMTPLEKEAFERIAVMIADGGLDTETLSELSEEELDEIVDWVLAGAGGIFEPYIQNEEDVAVEVGSFENAADFGLEDSISSLEQIEDLYTRIDQDTLTESDIASIGKLIGLEDMGLVEIDKLSQAILKLAQKYTEVSADGAEELVQVGEVNLRDVLKMIPTSELVAELESVLGDLDLDIDIPEMPEAVLKSLCTEIVNVNNKMLDAAEISSKLLDGLNNNDELREQILQSVSNEGAVEELIASVADSPDSSIDNGVLEDLVMAVVEDSSPEELEELNDEIDVLDADEPNAKNAQADGIPEDVVIAQESVVSQEEVVVEVEKTENVQNTVKDIEQLAKGEEVKVSVKSEVVEEVVEPQEQVEKEVKKDTAKDNLTGRAFSGDNNISEEGEVAEDSTDDERGSKDSSKNSFEDSVFSKDEVGGKDKATFSENFADADAKVDFKAFVPEAPQSRYLTDNPQVRYSDMIENMDRLSKLMMSTAEKAMKSITMELSPPELGKMTIEVSVKDGQTSAAIRVETDGARQMLMNNIEQLKRNLESHGLKLENFEVELNKEEQQSKDQQSEFAQAQEEERNRRSKLRQNANNSPGGGNGVAVEESIEAEQVRASGIGDDGSVDIVA